MGECREIPGLGATQRPDWLPRAHRDGTLDCILRGRCSALGFVGGRIDAGRGDAAEQEPHFGYARGVGAEPAEEADLNALKMRQRPVREVVGAACRQFALVDRRGQELAGPPGEPEPLIELEEPALLDVAQTRHLRRLRSRATVPYPERRPPDECPARCKGRMSVRPMVPPANRAAQPTPLRYAPPMVGSRPLASAEILSIGSELTVGETRDTNAGDLARSLTGLGIEVGRIQALPDDLDVVRGAFELALERSDLVISTGGLGPTPDDLTREAIAALTGETPVVDADLESWLRGLWSRRGMDMPSMNLKQAWLIPSADALPNANGTAPGWWVSRPDGRVLVALPGPPREMIPIWHDHVLPRLRERGAGGEAVTRTFRLAGIGESALADLLGEDLLRGRNPVVATYARSDAVDVRISARPEDGATDGDASPSARSARQIVDTTADRIRDLIGDYIWAEGQTTWGDAIGAALESRGWTLAAVEVGTGGSFGALLGDRDWLRLAETLAPDAPAAAHHRDPDETEAPSPPSPTDGLEALAKSGRQVGGSDVAVGIRVRARGDDTAVTVVVVLPDRVHRERRIAFLGGSQGRLRAALVAAHVLLVELRAGTSSQPAPGPTTTSATGG
jgi:nicotinamide-nucleotide amidase